MIYPTLEDARRFSADNMIIPISMELFSDLKTSIEILKTIKQKGQNAYILESVESGDNWGRYSFLGYNPSMTISAKSGTVSIKKDGLTKTEKGDPIQILRDIAAKYKSARVPDMPTFTGGFVGYFAYEYAKYTNPSLNLKSKDIAGFDDFSLMLFDKVIAIDNFKQKIYLIVNIHTNNLETSYIQGVTALKDMENMILSNDTNSAEKSGLSSDFQAQFSKEEFCEVVGKAKNYIASGDILQCVLSNQFKASYDGDLLQAYRILRTKNPSAYMFYLQLDNMQIAGASPETLISVKNGIVNTYPLAGTCIRTKDEQLQQELINSLLNDEKELAEHDMLVDLGRADLGRICKFGSVKVTRYQDIKKCSHVCHIASNVEGIISDDCDAFDALAAALPAGTLSGAPKVRSMEIIDELEGTKRGVYGGAIGYIDFTGDMDFCIGIRMAVLKYGQVYVQAGAGIVAQSIPENEYQECLNKAKAMIEALEEVRGTDL